MSTATIIAIDPGPSESAYVVWDGSSIGESGKVPNEEMRQALIAMDLSGQFNRCVIEMIASYGMPVGAEVFETCVWIGRFMEAFGADRCDSIKRKEIVTHLCGSARAKDANVRQALIDRIGKPGTKKQPGPTYGVAGDVWSALAVAVTWWDSRAVRQIAAVGAGRD